MIAVITQASCYFKLERGICLKPKIDAFLGKKVRSSGERISECVCNFYVDMCTGRYAGVWRSLSFAMGVLSSRGSSGSLWMWDESLCGWGLRGLSGCEVLSLATGRELWCCGVIAASKPIATSRSREMNEA